MHGPLPEVRRRDRASLIDLVDRSGLRGHGGAAFPTARKLEAVASRRGAKVVVANGTEGEPASKKDRVLLREAPHLVLDGVEVAAQAVGARDAIVAISERDDRSYAALNDALDERADARVSLEIFCAPECYLAGQESALINLLNGGEAKPSFGARPYERGVARRPTLVQNVETLAHVALIARHGADWFRAIGTDRGPGLGARHDRRRGRASGRVRDRARHRARRTAGDRRAANAHLRAVLVGGYFGTWLAAEPRSTARRLSSDDLSRLGAALGAGVIFALGANGCAVAETSRIADYFAAESAGQCGPCVNGLGAIADTVQQIATRDRRPGRDATARALEHRTAATRRVCASRRRRALRRELAAGVRGRVSGPRAARCM